MARRTWWKVGALLAAMMVFLTMLPATALAADGDSIVYVGGVTLRCSTDSPAYATTDDNGTVTTVDASADKYNIKWDGTTLTLDGAKIKGGTSSESLHATVGIYAFSNSGDVSLNIALKGVNEIFESSHGIWVYSSSDNAGAVTLTIGGEGSLNASGSSSGILVQSNSDDATLTIQNADVKADNSSSSGDGVTVRAGSSSSASLSVDGGSLTATGKNEDCAGIRYTFGSSSSGSGKPSLTVSGNTIVRANGGISDNSSTDIQIGGDNNSSGGIVFDGNEGTVYGSVTLQDDLEIGEGESLDIPSGASLDTDGKLTVDGGTLIGNVTGNVIYKVTGVSLSSDTLTLDVGESHTLTATIMPSNATNPNVTWSSDPSGLVTIAPDTSDSKMATITATGTGTTTIKATVDGKSAECTVTVNAVTAVPVTGVSLNTSTLNLMENETGTLTATVFPSNATNKGVTWESSNTRVATVDANGLVTAVGTGTVTITVTTSDGDKTATCTVTVSAKTYGLSASPASLDFGSVYSGYTQPATRTVTVTNTGNQSVTLAQPTSTSFVVGALSDTELDPGEPATFSVQPKSGLAAGTYSEQLAIATEGGSATCTVALSFSVRTPYVPPRPTGPDWDDVADGIADAEPGSTVTVDMDGETMLPGEVLDELACRDVTLALDMGDGLFWEICGGDVPADAEYDDVDLGVALGGDDIPADAVNLVTGEHGSVQVSLEHDGPFGFELTLVAPLGEDAAGLVANLYRYDDEAGSLGYEATAQVDGEGVARLPFDHASSWLFALDSRTHALPFSDANEGEWYSEAVRWAWLGGVMTGYGDGSGLFGTSSALTRAEAAVVLWRLAGEPEGVSGLPADCDPSGFYAEAASWALDAGVFSGYSGDAFGPADTITREQLATVLWRAAGSPEVGGDLSSFSDAADVSDFADVAMRWAVSVGVLRGQGDGDALDPQGACSRAQLATMLYRLAAAE